MLERIAKVLRAHKGDFELEVYEHTTFAELDLDSLDIVELVMSIEDEFSISIEMSEDIKSVGDLVKIIGNA